MMKKLRAIILFFLFSGGLFAQNNISQEDSLNYEKRKLKVEEINFVSSYYNQDGNNSAVTGGIGSEELTDFATTFDLILSKYDLDNNKHSLNFEFGFDTYTSASSDKIDPTTISSASKSDSRVYPSANYSYENSLGSYSIGGGLSYSSEFDYKSFGSNIKFSKFSSDNNTEFSIKASAYLDTWKVILPKELRPPGYGSGSERDRLPVDYKPRNSYNLGIVFSQVINKNFQIAVLTDIAYQEGLLGTKFNRVYFKVGTEATENLPDQRIKLPIGIRGNYFLGDNLVLRSYYRYYQDNWDIKAHTASLEVAYKITPFISFSPYFRYYSQTAAKDFKPYKENISTQEFYTSDNDLSQFQSNMFGLNAKFAAINGDLGIMNLNLNTIEFRYGYYRRSNDLASNILTMVITIKM